MSCFFSVRWCGLCRILAPLLEGVVADAKGNVDLAKMDTDVLPDLAVEYQVSKG